VYFTHNMKKTLHECNHAMSRSLLEQVPLILESYTPSIPIKKVVLDKVWVKH